MGNCASRLGFTTKSSENGKIQEGELSMGGFLCSLSDLNPLLMIIRVHFAFDARVVHLLDSHS